MANRVFIREIVKNLLLLMKKTNEPAPKGLVRLPRIFLVLPLLSGGIFAIPTTLILLEGVSAEILVPGTMLLLSAGLFMYFLLWRIKFDDNQFTYRNMFMYSRTYKYTEITNVKRDREDTIIHINRKRIRVPIESAGATPFLRIVRRYKKRK